TPCPASHSATARSPSSIASASRAARSNQAERLTPSRLALTAAARATAPSKATESFLTDMPIHVLPACLPRQRSWLTGELPAPGRCFFPLGVDVRWRPSRAPSNRSSTVRDLMPPATSRFRSRLRSAGPSRAGAPSRARRRGRHAPRWRVDRGCRHVSAPGRGGHRPPSRRPREPGEDSGVGGSADSRAEGGSGGAGEAVSRGAGAAEEVTLAVSLQRVGDLPYSLLGRLVHLH